MPADDASASEQDSHGLLQRSSLRREAQRRRRQVRRQLLAITPANSNPQRQSPLWSKLPAEIRNEIFTLAVSQHLDLSRPYPRNSLYYRPGYTHAFRVCTDLLATCRIAWWETNAIPLSSSTLPVWQYGGPYPPPNWRFAGLTARNMELLNHVQFFVRHLNSPWYSPPLPQLRPNRITVTIRHMSWYGWHYDEPLTTLDPSRSGLSPPAIKFPSCLEELVIEFEVLERMKDQLDEIIEARAKNWRFYREDGMSLSPASTPPRYYKWTGPADFGGRDWYLRSKTEGTDDYYVVALTYTRDPSSVGCSTLSGPCS